VSAFSDIFAPDIKLYAVKKITARIVDEQGEEQETTVEDEAILAIYDKGISENRKATNPTQHQHLIHVYTTEKNIKNDDKVSFNGVWFRLEFAQNAHDHFFYKGYADV
jgi:hypothetical protein